MNVLKRLFSTTKSVDREYFHVVRRRVKQPKEFHVGDPETVLPRKILEYPRYPYGPAQHYKQSDRGLYGGRILQFGNKISEKFKQKSTRIFYPNVQKTKLWSETLQQKIQTKVVASVLRTITKEGGLDNYLIKDSAARIKELGTFGWNLRYRVLKRMEEQELELQKVAVGLKVNKLQLIADLFNVEVQIMPEEDSAKIPKPTLTQFKHQHAKTSIDQLLNILEAKGVDTQQYKNI
ncbi:mitochondrial 54S ribosomal protein YmL24/YmL14 [Starmerella bacillaris]|uniref:Large ribosomal subunit protein bL28m n=1 Tax=Starmerella bacillaris TaxID=1247836 RepID=A0AAV5RMQ7_STABA|nr:mitochondrial 54S ribosomal protein YmL24/YmL14 [Starmerella bacillaris]